MSELPPEQPAGRDDDDTTLSGGIPGPSGTGGLTRAGADPDAPTTPNSEEQA